MEPPQFREIFTEEHLLLLERCHYTTDMQQLFKAETQEETWQPSVVAIGINSHT